LSVKIIENKKEKNLQIKSQPKSGFAIYIQEAYFLWLEYEVKIVEW